MKHENGDEMVCNVEYNQLEDVISHTIDPRGISQTKQAILRADWGAW